MIKKNKEKNINRIRKSKLNSTVDLYTSLFMGILSFIERTVFNQFFIADYLGLYSFYYNIINILNIVELGLYTSISYSLYGPLEHNDNETIAAIISFFRKAYAVMGTLILLAGLALLPFMNILISTTVPIENVKLYFILFLMGNVLGYYINYKNILYSANQEQYVVTLITNISWSFLYIIEIVITITTQSFMLYSIAILTLTTTRYIIIQTLATFHFKLPKVKKHKKLSPELKDQLVKNTKGVILNRVGQGIVSSTDSILISVMVGTALLGKYSNYQMISTGLLTIAVMLPRAITASVGNAGITESKRTLRTSFDVLNLGSYLIYSYLTVLIFNLFNPIVSTFFGADKILSLTTVILISMIFYINSLRELLLTYKTSLGLYWQDRKRPIWEGLINLVLSIAFGYFWGLNGILLGTVLTGVCLNLVIEPQVIFHNGLMRSTFWYYVQTILRFILTLIIAFITYCISSFIIGRVRLNLALTIGRFSIPFNGIITILLIFTVTTAISSAIYYFTFKNEEEMQMIKETIKIAFSKKNTTSNEEIN